MAEPASSAPPVRPGIARWGIALAVVVAALALRAAMQPWIGDGLPFVTMFGAVAATAWWVGTGPSVVVAVIGFVASMLLYRGPEWLRFPWASEQWLTFGGYVFSAGVIVLFGHALIRARARAEGETRRCLEAEAEAQDGRRRLEVTLRSIGDGVLVCDTEGRVESLNPVAQQLTGWREEDARGRSLQDVFDIVNEHTGEVVENPAMRALSERVIVGLANHTVLRPRDGTAVPIEDSAAPIVGDDGRTLGAVLVFRDARAQRENEQRLEQAHEALHVVIQALPLAAVVLDAGRREVQLWNEAAERLFGVAAADAMGRPLTVLPPDQVEEHLRRLARVEGGQTLQDEQSTMLHIDGRRLPLRMSAVPLLDAAGTLTGSLLLLADLSERLRIEASLQQSEAQARLALDIARLGTWSWDVAADVVRADARTREIVGLPDVASAPSFRLADVVGRVHDGDWARVEASLSAAVRPDSEGRYAEEFRFAFGADEQPRWVLAHGQALYDLEAPVRRVTRVLGSLLDITERKRAEEALAEADRRKDEFIATLAHELRNPLAPLRNGVHLLRILIGQDVADRQAAAAAKPLAIMERQIAHMVRLIDDLLDLARVSGGKLELQRHRIDIADAVREAVETSQSLIQAGGHRLTVALPSQPVFVDADVTRLCQVIANLLNNAAKYTPEGGHIGITVDSGDPGWVEVEVEDDGRGLAPEMLPQIFQMFTQVDRQAGRAAGGLGIGLAIARRLTQMHGGELRASSAGLGQGSRFVVRLPRADAGPGSSAAGGGGSPEHAIEKQASQRASCRVLIADDNVDAAESLNTLLQLRGCETRIAHDGAEAFALAEAMPFDIALLDIGMPALDGHQLVRRIRAQPWGRAIELVAVTGWGQDSDQRASADAGFDMHWVKPVDPAALEALIERVAAARAQAQPPDS